MVAAAAQPVPTPEGRPSVVDEDRTYTPAHMGDAALSRREALLAESVAAPTAERPRRLRTIAGAMLAAAAAVVVAIGITSPGSSNESDSPTDDTTTSILTRQIKQDGFSIQKNSMAVDEELSSYGELRGTVTVEADGCLQDVTFEAVDIDTGYEVYQVGYDTSTGEHFGSAIDRSNMLGIAAGTPLTAEQCGQFGGRVIAAAA